MDEEGVLDAASQIIDIIDKDGNLNGNKGNN
jgi:hypothetical protein